MNVIYKPKNEQEFNAINGYVRRQGLADVNNNCILYYYDVGVCISIDHTNKHYVWRHANSAPFNNHRECESLYDLIESDKFHISFTVYGTPTQDAPLVFQGHSSTPGDSKETQRLFKDACESINKFCDAVSNLEEKLCDTNVYKCKYNIDIWDDIESEVPKCNSQAYDKLMNDYNKWIENKYLKGINDEHSILS